MEAPQYTPVEDYAKVRPLLRHVRIMNRVMDFIDEDPQMRRFHPELYDAYMAVLQEEFAPHALVLALALTELEDAYPEIVPPDADK
jgi:hypothetical protein